MESRVYTTHSAFFHEFLPSALEFIVDLPVSAVVLLIIPAGFEKGHQGWSTVLLRCPERFPGTTFMSRRSLCWEHVSGRAEDLQNVW